MSQTVKGVISRSKKAPTEVVDVVIPDPGARDVVVAIKAVLGKAAYRCVVGYVHGR